MTTAAILAGGESRRMGRDKAMVRLADGRPMIAHVAAVLADALGGAGFILGGDGAALPAGWRHLPDARPGQGPLAGIEVLLGSGADDDYIVCPCDLPRLDAAVVRALATRGTDRPATVLRLPGEDAPLCLPARFAASALPVVRAHLDAGRRAVKHVLTAVDAAIVDADPAWVDSLANVNTPDELARLA